MAELPAWHLGVMSALRRGEVYSDVDTNGLVYAVDADV